MSAKRRSGQFGGVPTTLILNGGARLLAAMPGSWATTYLVLAALSDTDWRVEVSTLTLAKAIGRSKRQTIRIVEALEAVGLIDVQRRVGRASIYTLATVPEGLQPPPTSDTQDDTGSSDAQDVTGSGDTGDAQGGTGPGVTSDAQDVAASGDAQDVTARDVTGDILEGEPVTSGGRTGDTQDVTHSEDQNIRAASRTPSARTTRATPDGARAAHDAAVGCDEQEDEEQRVRNRLIACGVKPPVAFTLVQSIDGLTIEIVDHFAERARGPNVANPGGLLASLVREEAPDLIDRQRQREQDERRAEARQRVDREASEQHAEHVQQQEQDAKAFIARLSDDTLDTLTAVVLTKANGFTRDLYAEKSARSCTPLAMLLHQAVQEMEPSVVKSMMGTGREDVIAVIGSPAKNPAAGGAS
jgi:hypothetical protein